MLCIATVWLWHDNPVAQRWLATNLQRIVQKGNIIATSLCFFSVRLTRILLLIRYVWCHIYVVSRFPVGEDFVPRMLMKRWRPPSLHLLSLLLSLKHVRGTVILIFLWCMPVDLMASVMHIHTLFDLALVSHGSCSTRRLRSYRKNPVM